MVFLQKCGPIYKENLLKPRYVARNKLEARTLLMEDIVHYGLQDALSPG